MSTTPERFIWALELMNIKPNEHVLEIGCGTGILSELIAEQIESGSFLAIDKSAQMIAKAKKRNQKYIDSYLSEFIVADFSKYILPSAHFDCIVAFNVNFFWKEPGKELEMIRQGLKDFGKLYIFYQAPYEITISAADPIRKNLINNAFDIIDIKLKTLLPTSAICIIARPIKHH
ncbi:methyltransferase type 11 [Flammeovirgaceae bacterium 311]|nr:methyltransferase type 11 [Flammeovirgaceae bacterium 311]